MLLWEFLLTSDRARDLSDGERALAWLKATDYFPHFAVGRGGERCDPPPDCWTDAHVEFFRERLLALRSLGARLKGFKSREPHGNEFAADATLEGYVRYLAYRVGRKGRAGSGGAPRPLDRRTFDGLKLTTETPAESEEWLVERSMGLDTAQQFVLLELDKFFAAAFVSMVIEGVAPTICGRCGRQLELTPTGRKPKAKFCAKCQFPAWQDTQSQEQKRERWRRDKQQQRGTSQEPKRRK